MTNQDLVYEILKYHFRSEKHNLTVLQNVAKEIDSVYREQPYLERKTSTHTLAR